MRPLTPRQADLICVPRNGEVAAPEHIPVLVELIQDGLINVEEGPAGTVYVTGTPRLYRARRVHLAWLASGGAK